MHKNKLNILFAFSFIISVLLLVVSIQPLSTTGFYENETALWQIQCMGQDLVDLVLVIPCLMFSALFMQNGHLAGRLVWPGVIAYIIYTFSIYCFSVHFNVFFIEYCLILGLSLYALAYFLYSNSAENRRQSIKPSRLTTLIAVYLLLIGTTFYLVWFKDIIYAIRNNTVPATITDAGLPTNPVYVLDLAVVLPMMILTGILMMRRQWAGFMMAPYLLTFCVLMDVTILVLNVIAGNRFLLSAAFTILLFISLYLLISLIRQYYRLRSETIVS